VEKLLYLLPVLACPVGMGLMMWFMMRGGQRRPATDDRAAKEAELSRLQTEVDQLRAAEHTRLQAEVDQLRAAARDRSGNDPGPRP
jgi:hypothetical protein